MSSKAKMIIMAIVAFFIIATVAVIIMMTNSGEKAVENNTPSTAVATESVTQTANETVDDNELEIITDEADNADVSNNNSASNNNRVSNNSSNEKNDAENKSTAENQKTEINEAETPVEKNTQGATTQIKDNAGSKEETKQEPTIDYEQSVEDAINGNGDAIELPILPVD